MAGPLHSIGGGLALAFAVLILTLEVNGLVHEVNQKTLKKFLTGKLFTLTFVDSPSCSRCRTLFPFYVTAANQFPNDPDIFFTRTHDSRLVGAWGISELPALVYYRDALKTHQVLHGVDITVDDIVDTIARILHGDFGGLTRTYAVKVTEANYDELIMTPKQHVLLLIHDKKDTKELKHIETVARAFRNDEAILLATLDVSKHQKLRDERFMTRDTPVLMWLDAKEKSSPKRFGGVLSPELITMFVNERTGLMRNHDGTLLKDAGRIPKVDEIVESHKEDIFNANPKELEMISVQISSLKSSIESQHRDMLEYYLYILENISLVQDTAVIGELIKDEEAKLYEQEDISPKAKDALKRKGNILQYFKAVVDEAKQDKANKRGKKDSNLNKEAVLKDTTGFSHSHIHTEL